MQEEGRVVGGREEVTCIAANSKVPRGVHPKVILGSAALKFVLEVGDGVGGGTGRDVEESRGRHPVGGCVAGQVATEAAWVVGVVVGRDRIVAIHARYDWTEVNGHAEESKLLVIRLYV